MDAEVKKYLDLLNSKNENERSDAAANLWKLKHPSAPEACLKTINDAPDFLHLDMTPSVYCLIEIGEPVLPALLALLSDNDAMTRLRALRAMEGITLKIWKSAASFKTEEEAMAAWQQWWVDNNYVYENSSNTESIKKINDWLQSL